MDGAGSAHAACIREPPLWRGGSLSNPEHTATWDSLFLVDYKAVLRNKLQLNGDKCRDLVLSDFILGDSPAIGGDIPGQRGHLFLER